MISVLLEQKGEKEKKRKEKRVYLPCIMGYGKIGTRKLRLDEPFIIFECLVQFLSKRFMCGFGKHTTYSG